MIQATSVALHGQHGYTWQEMRMIRDTVHGLFNRMQSRFVNFPSDYLVIDTETTGVEIKKDLITQVGHCYVRDGKPIDQGAFVLDWTRHPQIDQKWLAQRLEACKRHVEIDKYNGQPSGRTYHMSYARMRDEGSDPEAILREYCSWFKDVRQQRLFFVAHNGYHFDCQLFAEHFSTFVKESFHFDDYEVFDTGMVEKAAQASVGIWPEETPKAYSRRVYSMWLRGVKWNLDKACVPKYGLDKDHNLHMDEAHDAGYDSYVTHLLFECFKEIAGGSRQDPTYRR
jgi:DNA polymerase III epsilon subunit-like protein